MAWFQGVSRDDKEYEVVQEWVYVGPGKGTHASPVEQRRKEEAHPCFNTSEEVAAGKGYFRKGCWTKLACRIGLLIMFLLLISGFVCLGISFFGGNGSPEDDADQDGPTLARGEEDKDESLYDPEAPNLPKGLQLPGLPPAAAPTPQAAAPAHHATSDTDSLAGPTVAEVAGPGPTAAEVAGPTVEPPDEPVQPIVPWETDPVSKQRCQELENQLTAGSLTNALSDTEQGWCCEHELLTCPKFECDDEDPEGWSVIKRRWCCKNHAQGCILKVG